MLAVLRNRNYFWLWFGQMISNVGDGMRDFAMMFWVFKASGHDPLMLALSTISVALPNLVVAPIAGVWVDRWDRRRTMIVSDLIRGLLSLLLIVTVLSGQYILAMGVTFLASCVAQFFNPSRSAMVKRVVGPEHLLQATSLGMTTLNMVALLSPPLGGLAFRFFGPAFAFAVDAASFFGSALCIFLVRASGAVESTSAGRSFRADLTEGLGFTWRSRPVRAIIIALTILMAGAGAINALGMLIISNSFHLSEETISYFAPVQTLFGLLSAVLLGTAARKLRRVPLLVPAGLATFAVAFAFFTFAPNIWWFAAGLPFMGIGNTVMNLGVGTTTLRVVPDRLLGRVNAVLTLPINGAMMLSAGVVGAVARYIDPRYILAFAGVWIIVSAVSAYAGLRDVVFDDAPQPQPAPAAS
jgi:MFS family permease